MSPGLYLRYMARESRGSLGRLVFFIFCLSVGVAGVAAVASMSDSIEEGIRAEARTLLAADLVVEGSRPLPEELDRHLESIAGSRSTVVLELPTIIAAPGDAAGPGRSMLAGIKAIDGDYPFYGTLRLDPDRPLAELLRPDTAVVGPEALERLGLELGGRLHIGGTAFSIEGVVHDEPDRLRFVVTLGPRVFLSKEGLDRAGLQAFGSRILHRRLIRLPDGADAARAAEVAAVLKEGLPGSEFMRIETFAEAQPGLRDALSRTERFLGLVALLSLLMGGIGVAQAVRAWLAGRIDAIAVLKSLGVRPREILWLYLGQTFLLSMVGSAIGLVAAIGVLMILPFVIGDLLPVTTALRLQPMAALRGAGLGVGVAILFSLPSLIGIRRVPPARVFRNEAEPLPGSRLFWWGAWILLIGGIGMMSIVQSGSVAQGLLFTGAILAAAGVLALGALALSRIVGRAPRRAARVWLRHGLSALSRPGAGTLGAIVALGMGVVVVLSMHLVQIQVSDQLRAELPTDAPTAFLVGIQPSQREGVRELLRDAGATRIDSVPVTMARLREVDGRPVRDLLEEEEAVRGSRRRRIYTREHRLTYMNDLPEDNVVVDGELWQDDALDEISIEKDYARDMGVSVGSTVVFDIQGVPLELTVTSLRTVEWEGFGINFFLIVEPGILDDAPQFHVTATRLPSVSEQTVQDQLAAVFPNVTYLRIREILEKVAAILETIGLGIRLLGGFTVLTSIAILAGAVSAGLVKRAREVALLKTLGMTRRGVVAVFSVEYALIGLVAGAIGAVGGGLVSWTVLTQGMEMEWTFRVLPYLLAVMGSIGLTVLAGISASTRALSRRPIEVLRAESIGS